MNTVIAIPTIPCRDIDETLAFYAILGFTPTLVQKNPIPYAVMLRGGAEIHFYRMRGLDPDNSYGGCIIEVDEVETLHATFVAALRAAMGKVPLSGRPRITRMRKGQTRFSVIDPAGNWMLFARHDEEGHDDGATDAGLSPLGKALRTARRLRDYKNDIKAAARVLDTALGRSEPEGLDYARALIWRAEMAMILGDPDTAENLMETFAALPLAKAERSALTDDLAAFDMAADAERLNPILPGAQP